MENSGTRHHTGSFVATLWQPRELAITGFLAWALWTVIFRALLSPLARYPGPLWARITGLWHITLIRRQEHIELMKLHTKYGPVVRIGPNTLSITHTHIFRKIYNAAAPFPKSSYYGPFTTSPGVDIFTERNEKLHGKLKRHFSSAYGATGLRAVDDELDAVIQRFISRLASLEGKTINMPDELGNVLFDLNCQATLTHDAGFIESPSKGRLVHQLHDTVTAGHYMGFMPIAWNLFQVVRRFASWFIVLDETQQTMTHLIKTQLQAHKDSLLNVDTTSNDMKLGSLFSRLSGLVDSGAVSNNDIISVIGFTLAAGCSDGGTWLSAVFYYLLKHPAKYSRLMEELYEKEAEEKLGSIAKARETAEFPYLNAVLHEALRLCPPLVSITPREVPEGGLELDGAYIPKGTIVGCPAWVIHRLPEVWGEDAEDFVPERWIDSQNKAVLHRYFMGFGSGSRTCLGRNLGFLEARKLVPSILMAYDFELTDEKGWELQGGGAVSVRKMPVRVRKRTKKNESPHCE